MIPRPDSQSIAANGTPVAGPAPQAGPAEPGDEQQPRLEFFRQPWVQNVLPFVTSLAVHCVIIVLGIAAAKILIENVLPPSHKEQTIIPDTHFAVDSTKGQIPNVGPHDDPFKQVMQNLTPDGASANGWAPRAGPTVDMTTAAAAGDADASPLAIGPNGVLGSKDGKTGAAGNGDGTGPLAQFGLVTGGGAIGPKGPIFGHGGGAMQIIFVCDCSGSMLNKMATLKQELQKAVDGLKPVQSFNIVFFQNQTCSALDRNGMVPATPDNKRKAFAFLDNVTPSGTTDPIPGLTLAFGQHPELVYLLTDGDFPDNKEVKAKVAQLNRDGKTKVNTIAFVGNTDTETEFLALLEDIAKSNGGNYRHVTEDEVAQQQ